MVVVIAVVSGSDGGDRGGWFILRRLGGNGLTAILPRLSGGWKVGLTGSGRFLQSWGFTAFISGDVDRRQLNCLSSNTDNWMRLNGLALGLLLLSLANYAGVWYVFILLSL